MGNKLFQIIPFGIFVGVAGDVSVHAIVDSAGSVVGEFVPDVLALPVHVPRPFDLKIRFFIG